MNATTKPAVLINATTTCAICGWDLEHPHRGRSIPDATTVRLTIEQGGQRTPIAVHAPCLMRDGEVLGRRIEEALLWRDQDTEAITNAGLRIFHAAGGRVA